MMESVFAYFRTALPKWNKAVWIVLSLLLLFGVGMFLFCSNQEGFTGSRIHNPDAYFLDIIRMNGTDLHTMELHREDILQIRFETAKGSLYMDIKAPDGTTIYRGNGEEITDFTVNIPQDGIYTVVVVARHARGNIEILPNCGLTSDGETYTESRESRNGERQ